MAVPALGQSRPLEGQQIVLYTSGGTQLETTKELVIKPFEEETGATVIIDDSCCSRLQAALEAKQFVGDLVVGLDRSSLLARDVRGWILHDPRIMSIASSHGVLKPLRSDGVLVLNLYSFIIAAKNASAPLPKSWKEFWDVKNFPGTRGMIRSSPHVQMEAALLADGVDPDALYPLDADRAFRKLDALKASTKVLMNASGADQINNLGTGETTYAVTYSNRAFLAKRDGIPINFSYADGFIVGNSAALLKGAKNVDGAIALLEFHMRPEILARFAERTGMAPPYKASVDMIAPEYKAMLPTSVENLRLQHPFNDEYWQKNLRDLTDRWVKWLAQ
jgi:putative spermidine/putrescine transport system substrate-binding protein